MALPNRSQLPALLLVAAGIALVVVAVVVFHPGQPAYEHDVQRIGTDQAAEMEERSMVPVSNYSALSPTARNVFDQALANGGEATVYGEANRPAEWEYGGDYASYAVVRYEGSAYEVVTFLGSPLVRWLGTFGAGAVGLLFGGGGWAVSRRARGADGLLTTGLALAVAVAAVAVGVGTLVGLTRAGVAVVAVVFVAALAVSVFGWTAGSG